MNEEESKLVNNIESNNSEISASVPTPEPTVVPTTTPETPVVVPTPESTPVTPAVAPAPVVEPPVSEAVSSPIETTQAHVQTDESIDNQEVEVKFDEGLSNDMIINDSIVNPNGNDSAPVEEGNSVEQVENIKTHKFPIILIGAFVLVVVIVLVYFFAFMTPRRAFNSTINNFFDNTFDFLINLKSNDHPTTINATFDADVKTDYKASLITEEQEIKGDKNKNMSGSEQNGRKNYTYLERYNNMRFTLNTIADFDNGDYGFVFGTKDIVRFSSGNLEAKVGGDVTKISLFLKDGKVYLGESKLGGETILGGNELDDENNKYVMTGKVLELTENPKALSIINNLNYSKFNDYKSIFNSVKDDLIKSIKADNLTRKLTFKKINDHSNLVLKSSISLNNSEINEIYKTVISKYIDDNDMLKNISDATGLSVEDIKDKLKELNDENIDKNNININLYTNVFATNIMCIEVTIDNVYINISSINNEIVIIAEKYKVSNDVKLDLENLPEDKELAVDLSYDTKDETINGTIYVNNEDTGLYVEVDYAKQKDSSDTKFDAKLNVKFSYVDDEGTIYKDKPFAEMTGNLSITKGKEVELFTESMSVADYLEKLAAIKKDESKETVLYNFVGDFSSLFTDFTHYYGAVMKHGTFNKHTMTDYQKQGESFYPDLIFKSLLGDKYSDDVMEAYSMLVVCIGYMQWDYDPAIFVENYPYIFYDYSANAFNGQFDISNYSYSKD